MKSNFSTSSTKSKRSSTFFTSLSQSGTQNTNSSLISHSGESHSVTGASAEVQRHPNSPMTVIRETDNPSPDGDSRIPPEADEDCPSIPEEHSDQELYGMTPQGDSSESPATVALGNTETKHESRCESADSEKDELITAREEPDLASESQRTVQPEEHSPLLTRNKDTL